jgi:hypothetical protein
MLLIDSIVLSHCMYDLQVWGRSCVPYSQDSSRSRCRVRKHRSWAVLSRWSDDHGPMDGRGHGWMKKWRIPQMGVPQNGWLIMELKMDDIGVPPILGNNRIWTTKEFVIHCSSDEKQLLISSYARPALLMKGILQCNLESRSKTPAEGQWTKLGHAFQQKTKPPSGGWKDWQSWHFGFNDRRQPLWFIVNWHTVFCWCMGQFGAALASVDFIETIWEKKWIRYCGVLWCLGLGGILNLTKGDIPPDRETRLGLSARQLSSGVVKPLLYPLVI